MSLPMIGPTLPPNWSQNSNSDDKEDNKDIEDKEDIEDIEDKEDIEDNDVFGPTLPPNYGLDLQKQIKDRIIGPTIPEELKRSKKVAKVVVNDSDEDSDDMIGPILPTHHKYVKHNQKFGNCLEALAKREAESEKRQEREEWMVEMGKPLTSKIPTKSVKHFSQRPVKSMDKNTDKYVKRDEKRDQELSELMDSFNKSQKRDVSLIDIHTTSKKSKKSDSKEREERVPFDPEKDLSMQKMNSRQTRSVLNKAKTFNDRFSLGINKFL